MGLLHWAARHDMPELCSRLMGKGADPRDQDADGMDAFEHAEECKSRQALAQLEAGPPEGEPPVLMVPVSAHPRHSKPLRITGEEPHRQTKKSVNFSRHRTTVFEAF